MFRPLDGLRVVDVTTSLAGPYCTEVLGALGADVIKVEPPGSGDEARHWGPPFHDGTATMFLTANANKRSVAVELRRGSDIVLRLAERADVFVVSLRPGLAEERGLAAAEVRARNERLVYASISGFGTDGPLAGRPGYDPLAQAAAGILSVTGEADRDPVRVGVSLVDQTTGIWAALSILAAVHQGRGATIELSLYATAVSLMGYHLAGYAASGAVPGRHGTAFPSIAPYEVFDTADGQLMLAVGNDRTFASFCAVVGLEQLPGDPRYRIQRRAGRETAPRCAASLPAASRRRRATSGSSASRRRTCRPHRCRTRPRCSRIRRPTACCRCSAACRLRGSRSPSTASAPSTSRRPRRSAAILTPC